MYRIFLLHLYIFLLHLSIVWQDHVMREIKIMAAPRPKNKENFSVFFLLQVFIIFCIFMGYSSNNNVKYKTTTTKMGALNTARQQRDNIVFKLNLEDTKTTIRSNQPYLVSSLRWLYIRAAQYMWRYWRVSKYARIVFH